jgi:thioredoxin 1
MEKTLYKFYADWCGPCKIMNPVVDKLVKTHGLVLVSVNIDDEPHRAHDHDVRSIPTLVLEHEDGSKTRVVGVRPYYATEQALGLTA